RFAAMTFFPLLLLLLPPRAAFLCLAGLLLLSAAPLAWAWTLLLPREPDPFEDPGELPEKLPAYNSQPTSRDPVAIVLLVLATLSFASQLPGVPLHALQSLLTYALAADTAADITVGLHWFFLTIPAVGAIYAVWRGEALRVP